MADTITTPRNPRLQALRRLQRRRERDSSGAFVAEGEDLIEAATRAGCRPLQGYRLAGTAIGDETFLDVEADALASVCTLASGSRALAVYAQRWASAPTGPLCLYLHALADPGNVGAALRSAHAFGASCVALGPRCADPHSPKAVRASMGAIFAVPIARCSSVNELPGEKVALVARRGVPLRELGVLRERREPVSVLIGAERDGLPDEAIAGCDQVAHIPIASESLNAAMAATVALYEITRDSADDSYRVRA